MIVGAFLAFLLLSIAAEWYLTRKPDPKKIRAKWGHFEGLPAVTSWVPGTSLVELVHTVTYVRPDGTRHEARQGLICDAASIPRWAWWIIGHPFRGKYREPAFLHDQMCRDGEDGVSALSSAEVHWIFRCAIRAAGGGPIKAWAMWAAVRVAGPHWSKPKGPTTLQPAIA